MIQTDVLNLENSNLKTISSQDFLEFGIEHVAYVRSIDVESGTAYAIHAANGTPLSVMDTLDEALTMIHHNDLDTVALH